MARSGDPLRLHQLHRSFGRRRWRVGETDVLIAYSFESKHWQLLGPVENPELTQERFRTRADAHRALLASAAAHPLRRVPVPPLRPQGDGTYRCADWIIRPLDDRRGWHAVPEWDDQPDSASFHHTLQNVRQRIAGGSHAGR